jgi:hypothetical protein
VAQVFALRGPCAFTSLGVGVQTLPERHVFQA